ncbi:sulfatase [Thermodesulfovibrio sp. 3462-1]|uniref:Sulfatase n=1 Tax=Thermodesulfovibrio obliviosus TaxID=3118332 RepID=A0AAU8H2M3_9BACT
MKKRFPNIVLIVCDTLGAKHMSLYGYWRKTTPMLEKMVEKDNFAIYTRCFSPAPWTVPAHVSLFTGLYPSEHLTDGDKLFLSKNFYTLPEIVKNAGFTTIGITNNALVSRLFGYARGFDKFYEVWNIFEEKDNEKAIVSNFLKKTDLEKIKFLLKSSSRFPLKVLFKVVVNGVYKKLRPLSKDASSFTLKSFKIYKKILKECRQPFFIFINLMQTHDKYNPPQKYRNIFIKDNPKLEHRHRKETEYLHYAIKPFEKNYLEYMEGLYDEEILFLDEILFRMYEEIKKLKIQDNTLFIITADHGELFGEHGHVHHLFTTYNELIHIPLIISYPKEYGIKGEINNLVQLHDLFATIHSIVESPLPAPNSSIALMGNEKRDFACSQLLDVGFKIDACKEKNPDFDPDNFSFNCKEIALINKDLYKLIKRSNGQQELYNLQKDLYETQDLMKLRNMNIPEINFPKFELL